MSGLTRSYTEKRNRPRTLQAQWMETDDTLNIILSEPPPPAPVDPPMYSKHRRRKSLVLKPAQWVWQQVAYAI